MTHRRANGLVRRGWPISVALALLVISGCSTVSPSPWAAGSGASSATINPRFPGYLRVEVTGDGRVLVEEVELSVAQLASVLDGLATKPTILYHRSNPNEDPPPIFEDVLDEIASRQLPIRLVPEDFTSPHYSPPPL